MLNSEDFYRDLGKKSAEARNQGDEARASFHASHFREARNLESWEDHQKAYDIYSSSYKLNRRA